MQKMMNRFTLLVAIFVITFSTVPTTVFAKKTPTIPEAVDPGTPEYSGDENPVPNEPIQYNPSKSMMKEIYNKDKANGGESYWVDRILERSGAQGGTDLFTRGRALFMFTHNPRALGFGGGYAYREMPTGSEQDMYTISISDTSLTEDTSERKQYPSYWLSKHKADNGLSIEQKKFITYNNVAVTVLNVTNTGAKSVSEVVNVSSPIAKNALEGNKELTGTVNTRYDLTTMYPRLSGDNMVVEGSELTQSITLEAGESTTIKVQMGVTTKEIPESVTDYERIKDENPETVFMEQIDKYNEWWSDNVPYIDIPDQNIKKMSYYRTFLNRYNYLDANIPGNDFQFPVSIEGVLGYNNAIQLTQPMHMQDLKYWRDPMYSYGNWLSSGESSKYSAFQDNPGDPAHWNNTYEQWIVDEAWESYKVHGGDPKVLKNLVRYAEGDLYGQLDKYDTNDNFLVQYDWGSLTGNDADAVALNWKNRDQERTDQSSFIYSGALATAEAFRLLDNEEKAEEMVELAENVQESILDILWDDSEGENGKVFKQKDIESGELVPWKDQQNFSPFTHGVAPDTDEYKQALRFYADKEQFPIMPFFTANQHDKKLAEEAGVGGSNNFANINATLQARLYAKALRDYPSEYITPEMYRKLIEWLTWTQYVEGDNRYPDNNEFWNSYDEKSGDLNYRSWIHHNILGAYNFSLIEDIAGMKPRSDEILELWPIDMGYEYFTINNLRYHDSDLTIVWDNPDGEKHYGDEVPPGYSVYIDGERVFTVNELVHLTYDSATGVVTIEDDSSKAVVTYNQSTSQSLKNAIDVTLADNPRAVDLFQKAGVDLSEETKSAVNIAVGKDVSASYTSKGSSPEEVTKVENAVDGYTVSGLPTTREKHYAAPNPIWGTRGSPNDQDWYEIDFGESTSFDNVKLYFYNDKERKNYKEPLHYTIQYLDGEEWKSIPSQRKSTLQANFNEVMFNTITAQKMRVLMTPYPGTGVGLKEIQVFETGIKVPEEENKAPIVEIHLDKDYNQPMKERLFALVSDDGQKYDFPELEWSKKTGPGSVVFSDTESISTVASFTDEGTYVLTLTADDGEHTTSVDVEIQVELQSVNLALNATPTTSFISGHEDLNAINNGIEPENSRDKTGGAYGNWANADTEWVQYTWPEEIVMNQSDVYWWTDGGGILMPSSYKLEYLDSDGSTWKEVEVISGLGVKPDQYNTTIFKPITTKALRMTINRGKEYTGILEWKVSEPPVIGIEPDNVKIRVQAGEQPELPKTVKKIYVGNLVHEVGITWDSISDEKLSGDDKRIDIWGALDSSPELIPGQVYVRNEPNVTINTVSEANVTTEVGVEPRLPLTAEVQYNDGSMDNMNVEVTWESIDPAQYEKEGEFTVKGSVKGTDLPAIANVSVIEEIEQNPDPETEPKITLINPEEISTKVGEEPKLPTKVTVEYDDDSSNQLEVTWESMDPSQYAAVGNFEVKGEVKGTDLLAIAYVKVIEDSEEDTDLVLWYTFDELEGNEIEDSSGYGNHGELYGDANWIDGKFAGGLQFDGSDNYINAGTSTELQPDHITVSYWIKRVGDMNGKNNIFWAKPDAGWNQEGWYLTYDEGKSSFMAIDGWNRFYVDEPANDFLPAEEWTHVVVSFDSETKDAAIYKNGIAQEIVVEEDKNGLESITASDDPKYMGYTNPTFDDGYISSAMDDFRIYNGAMTEEAVKELYTTQVRSIVSLHEVNVTTQVGVTPNLPAEVTAEFNDGTTDEVAVAWDTIDPIEYEEAGSFTVIGQVKDTSLEAKVVVTVVPILDSVELKIKDHDLEPGDSTTLSVSGLLSDGTKADLSEATIEYSSNYPKFTVFKDHKLTIVADIFDVDAIEINALVTLSDTIVYSNAVTVNISDTVDTSELEASIESAREFVENIDIGTEPGQYLQEKVDELNAVINSAVALLTDENVNQEDIDESVNTLNHAVEQFKESVIPPVDPPIDPPVDPKVTDIKVSQNDVLLNIDELLKLKVESIDTNGNSSDITGKTSYQSSDENIVAVSSNGELTAIGTGIATVKVTYNGFTKEVKVKVYTTEVKVGQAIEVISGKTFEIAGSNTTITMPDDLPGGTTMTVTKLKDSSTDYEGYVLAGGSYKIEFIYPEGVDYKGIFRLVVGYDSDQYHADQISLFYFNEGTGEWEPTEGIAKEGTVTLDVPQLYGSYGVFAETKDQDPTIDPPKDGSEQQEKNEGNDSGDELPKTASFMYNWLLIGALLLVIGLTIAIVMKKRRIRS